MIFMLLLMYGLEICSIDVLPTESENGHMVYTVQLYLPAFPVFSFPSKLKGKLNTGIYCHFFDIYISISGRLPKPLRYLVYLDVSSSSYEHPKYSNRSVCNVRMYPCCIKL